MKDCLSREAHDPGAGVIEVNNGPVPRCNQNGIADVFENMELAIG
jgi:hypothetical protein